MLGMRNVECLKDEDRQSWNLAQPLHRQKFLLKILTKNIMLIPSCFAD